MVLVFKNILVCILKLFNCWLELLIKLKQQMFAETLAKFQEDRQYSIVYFNNS